MDPAVREENYARALQKISDEVYWFTTWSIPVLYAYSSELDFTPTADEIPRFFNMSWK